MMLWWSGWAAGIATVCLFQLAGGVTHPDWITFAMIAVPAVALTLAALHKSKQS